MEMSETYLFDIETTSLSPIDGEISMLTYIRMGDDTVNIVRADMEEKLIMHILDLFKPGVGVITFNGDRFDFPFIKARMRHHNFDEKFIWDWYRELFTVDIRQYHVVKESFAMRGMSLKNISGMKLKTFDNINTDNHAAVDRYVYFQMIALASLTNVHVRKNRYVSLPFTNVKEHINIDL